ncbi:hypothetical protein AKJ39_03905, partial [candidate division MSBL1 archaeon SCGC-AAA259J03]
TEDLEELEFKDEKSAFRTAERLQKEAMKMLREGDVRDAAGKAWGATLNAARGAILAKRVAEPGDLEVSTGVTKNIREAVPENLVDEYFKRMGELHGACFYNGVCTGVERGIRRTGDIVRKFKEEARK